MQDTEAQINMFLKAMGSKVELILNALRLPDEESKDYRNVVAGFKSYFIPRRNVIYERVCFSVRCRMEREALGELVTEIHRLADTCKFGSLKSEHIRDQLVVVLRDKKLSECYNWDPELALEKAVNITRNSEAVKAQQWHHNYFLDREDGT